MDFIGDIKIEGKSKRTRLKVKTIAMQNADSVSFSSITNYQKIKTNCTRKKSNNESHSSAPIRLRL